MSSIHHKDDVKKTWVTLSHKVSLFFEGIYVHTEYIYIYIYNLQKFVLIAGNTKYGLYYVQCLRCQQSDEIRY